MQLPETTPPLPPPSESFGPPLDPTQVPDIWTGFTSAITTTPDNLALACTHQPPNLFNLPSLPTPPATGQGTTTDAVDDGGDDHHDDAYLRWSFATLGKATRHLHNGLLAHSHTSIQLGPHVAVVTFLRNGAEFVLAAWAAVAAGCVLVPLNPAGLKNNPDEALHMLRTALSPSLSSVSAVVFFVADADVAEDMDELLSAAHGDGRAEPQPPLLGNTTRAVRVLAAGCAAREGWVSIEDVIAAAAAAPGSSSNDATLTTLQPGPHHRQGGLVLFTSGTTSRPKCLFSPYAIVDTYTSARLLLSAPALLPGPGSRMCSMLPNNHGNGWSTIQAAHGRGAALVFPGPAFAGPAAVLRVLRRERITHTFLVATLVHALAAANGGRPLGDLVGVTFGGMALSRDVLGVVTGVLGARAVENAYGCTEGVVASTGYVVYEEGGEEDGGGVLGDPGVEEVAVGTPPVGHGIRIVDPETGRVVPRGTAGEIHGTGPMVHRDGRWGYVGGGAADEAFYTDERGTWFRTGDMGRMDVLGRVFVTGRYKDMIVRGGENISPAAMETTLCKDPALAALQPQVVGAAEPIAGEVPVVIVKGLVPSSHLRKLVRQIILDQMGPMYLPTELLSLEHHLDASDYPRTTSGKIQKLKLKEMVAKYLDGRDGSRPSSPDEKADPSADTALAHKVRSIWATALGLDDAAELDTEAPLVGMADSITVMQVRNKIKRQTGQVVPLAAMVEAGCIEGQIKLLLQQQSTGRASQPGPRPAQPQDTRVGPPRLQDMHHLVANPTSYEPTRQLVHQALAPFGLDWDDVQDVVPAYDSNGLQAQCGFYNTINFNLVVTPTLVPTISKQQLRVAVEAVMRNHHITRSFMVWNPDWASPACEMTEALHVVMRSDPRFFDVAIQDGGVLETLSDVQVIAHEGHTFRSSSSTGDGGGGMCTFPRPQDNTFPGPLYRALLFDVVETGGAAVVLSINHAISDHSMGQMLNDDLGQAIALALDTTTATAAAVAAKLPRRKAYAPYLDLHHAHAHSPLARAAAAYHIRSLRRLAHHVDTTNALWPAPSTWLHMTDLDTHYAHRNLLTHAFAVPALRAFRARNPRITVCTIVKAALAIVAARRSNNNGSTDGAAGGGGVAVFTSVEAGRARYAPFMPASAVAALSGGGDAELWEAADVAGPTVQLVGNVVEIPAAAAGGGAGPGGSVLGFLAGMQAEQELQTAYAEAPWRAIIAGLGDGNAAKRPWPLLALVHGSLMFNWAPGIAESAGSRAAGPGPEEAVADPRLAQLDNFSVSSVQKPRCGLVVTAGAAIGSEKQGTPASVLLLLRGAGLKWHGGVDSIQGFAEEMERVVGWLVDEGNGEKSVGEALALAVC